MKQLFFMFMIFTLNTACVSKMISAAIPQKGKNEDGLKKVRSVAIIAFDVLEFVPTGVTSHLGGSAGASLATAQTAGNVKEDQGELARDLYDEMTRELGKKGWRVLPLAKVTSNSYYQQLYQAKRPSLLQKAPNHFQRPIVMKGLMRPVNPVYLLTPEERGALAKALGVDAVVYARVSYSTRRNDYLGLGVAPAYLLPTLAFNMYSSTEPEPVWFDYGFIGPQSAESVGKVSGMEDREKIAQFSRPLAIETFQTFLR